MILPVPDPVQGAGAEAEPAAKPWPEDQRYGYLLLPDGRARPAGGAGGGVWEIAAGSRQASAGDFALKPHGYFLVRIFSSRVLSWSARSPTFIIWC